MMVHRRLLVCFLKVFLVAVEFGALGRTFGTDYFSENLGVLGFRNDAE